MLYKANLKNIYLNYAILIIGNLKNMFLKIKKFLTLLYTLGIQKY